MLLDSHAHFDIILDKVKNTTEDELVKNLKYSNIQYALQVSTEVQGLEWSRDFAVRNAQNGIRYTAGIHPSSSAEENELDAFVKFVESEMDGKNRKLLLGIGECGLDYFRMHQTKETQIRSFELQIDTAKKYRLPLIIHTRDSLEEGIKILKNKNANKGIMHCFSGDENTARDVLDLGFFISFAGNVTYKNAANLHEAAKYVPLDRLLLETDSPFLSPVPLRGKDNFPEYVKHTYKFIAKLKNISMQKLEDAVMENYETLL